MGMNRELAGKVRVPRVLKPIVRELRQALKQLYGDRLHALVLYGSWARGEAHEDSDIDLMVVLEGTVIPGQEIDRMLEVVSALSEKHGVLLSVYPVLHHRRQPTTPHKRLPAATPGSLPPPSVATHPSVRCPALS
ncbi:MAG: nucleotidyltransferase domain-containing protein [Armatimonadota bacterium]